MLGESLTLKASIKYIMVLFLVSIFLVSLIVFSGCGGSGLSEKENKGESGDVYRIGDVEGDWGYPSPFTAYPRGPGFVRMSYIFDTLVWKDEEGFIPLLAREWEFHEESNSYTFIIEEDVKWHDGEELSADDVVFTYEYLQEVSFNWADLSIIEEIKKVDEREVEISLEKPGGAFLNNIVGVVPILPEHIWEDIDNPGEFTEPEAVVGSGPYKLEDYDREAGSYRMLANEDYYLGEPQYEEIQFVKVSDPQMAIQRGDVDYVMIEPEAVETVEAEGLEVISGDHDWNLKLMFNHRQEPFDSKKFRQAIAYFVDTEELVERALRGHGLEGSPGLISPDSRWYNEDLPSYGYDPDRGREKLEDLGYEIEKNQDVNEYVIYDPEGERLELEVYTSGDYSREGELIKGFLDDAGIDVEVRSFGSSVLDDKIKNWNFQMSINGHGAVGGDPERATNLMVGQRSPHINIQYEDPELVGKIKEFSEEIDKEKRTEIADKVQEIYSELLPAYTLYHPTWYYAHSGEVDLYFTLDGIGVGTPLPLNKHIFVDLEEA